MFSDFVITGIISLQIADYGEFSNLRNFHQQFLGAWPQAENFLKLKIHHNQLFLMKFSQCYQNLKKIKIFFEKCKQTAEIS